MLLMENVYNYRVNNFWIGRSYMGIKMCKRPKIFRWGGDMKGCIDFGYYEVDKCIYMGPVSIRVLSWHWFVKWIGGYYYCKRLDRLYFHVGKFRRLRLYIIRKYRNIVK